LGRIVTIALWRANNKPPVELVVANLKRIKENQKVTGKGGARKQGYRLFLSRTAEVTAV